MSTCTWLINHGQEKGSYGGSGSENVTLLLVKAGRTIPEEEEDVKGKQTLCCSKNTHDNVQYVYMYESVYGEPL